MNKIKDMEFELYFCRMIADYISQPCDYDFTESHKRKVAEDMIKEKEFIRMIYMHETVYSKP